MSSDKKGLSLGIGAKLTIIFVGISAFIAVLLATIAYVGGSRAIRTEAVAKLGAVAELKTDRIEVFMNNRYGEIHVITGLDVLKRASDGLISDIENSAIPAGATIEEKRRYLQNNSLNYRLLKQYVDKYKASLQNYEELKILAINDITNAAGVRVFQKGDQIVTVAGYTGNLADHHAYTEAYDLMLRKGDGVATDQYDCPFLYSSSLEYEEELKKVSIVMSHGLARYGVPMSQQRLDTPVEQRFSLMMMFYIKGETVNKIMQEKTGLGESGETYLIEERNGKILMLTESRFEKGTALKRDLSNVKGLREHLERNEFKRGPGICLNKEYDDYRGTPVLSHNHMIYIGEHEVAMITEIDSSEVFQSVQILLWVMVGATAALLLIATILAIVFSRSIANPLRYGVGFAQSVATGDLTLDMDAEYLKRGDEIGDLARALEDMVKDLRGIINNVVTGATQLVLATDQISRGNQDLSQRTSEQASSLEEIASTIEESTAAINQNADHSNTAKNMSDKAFTLAQEGGSVVNDAVDSIEEINKSSQKIGEIISVINDIAFQTNLLALNAAVEAARAGEQGRGFAVVAGEVRNLAQRSGNAAKEIEDLIKDSIVKVGAGTDLVNKSGEAIREIIESVQEMSRIITEINAASSEQKQGMNQINIAVTEMDTMTQNNASLVEETASASEEMANQAQELQRVVEHFKIHESDNKGLLSSPAPKASTPKPQPVGAPADKKAAPASGASTGSGSKPIKKVLEDEGFEEF